MVFVCLGLTYLVLLYIMVIKFFEVSTVKYALTNCKILSGKRDMTAVEGQCVIIDGEIIKAILPEAEADLGDCKIKDLGGAYVMPGLINMHVHLAGNGKPQKKQRDNAKLVKKITGNPLTRAVAYKLVGSFAKSELMSGVTTIRTVGGICDFDGKLRDDIAGGKKVGPRILASNRGISVPGGHMAGSVAYAAKNAEEAVIFVEKNAAERVDLIKLMVTGGVLDAKEKGVPGELKMPPEIIKAACDKAHELGFKVAAHVESPEGVKVALENGVDSIEHGAKPSPEIIALFKERGASLCTTVSPAIPYALFDRSVSGASEVERYNGEIVFEGIIECAKAAIENDIPVVLGNDVGCPWVTQYDFWRELCYFHKYIGVSNSFALYTATARSAEIAGISNITGTIEVGKCADIIVTEKNPLDDLTALSKVKTVIARGRIFENPKVKVKKKIAERLNAYLA